MHRCQTDLVHIRSGALGLRRENEAMAPLPRGSETLGSHTMRPTEPRVGNGSGRSEAVPK
jgi:hypothetical protein